MKAPLYLKLYDDLLSPKHRFALKNSRFFITKSTVCSFSIGARVIHKHRFIWTEALLRSDKVS